MNIRLFYCLLPILLSLIVFSSCSEDQRKGFSVKPKAIGKAGSVIIVAENAVWEGLPGRKILELYNQRYPVLPQGEPLYDLKPLNSETMKALHREWRNIIYIGLLNDGSEVTKEINTLLGKEGALKAKGGNGFNSIMHEDLWANGQLIFAIFANTPEELVKAIEARKQSIMAKINASDDKQLSANNFQAGNNKKLEKLISDNLGLSMKIPKRYEQAIYDSLNQTIWIRKETGTTSNNLLIRTMDYKDQSQITEENLINLRDTLGKYYITSAAKDAYMMTDKVNLGIVFNKEQLNGKYALQAKGLWKMHNDFMGGPFVNYLVVMPDKGKIAMIDGFVHAPEKEKRPLIRQVELVIRSVK